MGKILQIPRRIFIQNFIGFVKVYWEASNEFCQLRILTKTNYITVKGFRKF